MSAFTDARAAFHAAAANMRRAEGLFGAMPTQARSRELRRLIAAVRADADEALELLAAAAPEPEPLPGVIAAHARDRHHRRILLGDLGARRE